MFVNDMPEECDEISLVFSFLKMEDKSTDLRDFVFSSFFIHNLIILWPTSYEV